MTDASEVAFPRRDEHGRIAGISDLLAMALAGVVAGAVALALFDGIFVVLGFGEFGAINGWMAVVLPLMVFVEDFRAWRGRWARIPVALLGAALGVAAGLIATGLANDLPGLVSGAIGAAVFTVVYTAMWYYGMRTIGIPNE
jgi:hypothetical protein